MTTTTVDPASVRWEYPHETLGRLASRAGDAPAVTFLDYRRRAGDGVRAGTPTTLTYADLHHRARSLAAFLQNRCRRGARVAIMCPHDATYAVAMLGCLYAGVIGIPLHPPELARDHSRLRSALDDSEPECVLTTRTASAAVGQTLDDLGRLAEHVICVDDVPARWAATWEPPEISPGSVAYLQYTSGSTGRPSGVRVTYRNLGMTHLQIRSHFTPRVTASWVPFFHDFGLVCGLLTPLSAGAHTVHLSPLAFVQEPFRWLETISRFRADWSIAPTFSLDVCVARVNAEQRDRLDLRSLRLLTVAAEPVRPESVEAFRAAFGPCGLAADAVTPCYGLAEATLAVTAPPMGQGTRARSFDRAALADGVVQPLDEPATGSIRLVSCGEPRTGVEIRIVDPRTRREVPAAVGEIWVRGPNVADGYWGRPQTTDEVFGARLTDSGHDSGHDDGERWLRTGDLGFHCDGQLYIADRWKDVVIVRGRNHYPQDIEATITRSAPVGTGTGAVAFPVPTPAGEALVMAVEADRAVLTADAETRAGVVATLRLDVSHAHGLDAHDVVLVRRGSLPRTTSGKIRRGACRDMYLRGELGS